MAETGLIIPTLRAIVERVADDVKSYVPGADARVRRSVTRAISLGLAGVSYTLHKFGDNIARESLPDCAGETGVERWRKMFGLAEVQPAKSTGTVTFTGTDTTVIPAGTEIVRNDDEAFTTDALGTITGGTVDIAVTASVAGTNGDTDAGSTLTLTEPIAGVDSLATVAAGGITGGVDEEGTEPKRTRVLERMADPPQGGSNADFVSWVKTAVGNVREVWVSQNEPTIGHVAVRFIVEPDDGDPANAIPSPTQVQDAEDYIVGTSAENFEDAAAPVPLAGDDDLRVDVRELTAQPVTLTLSALSPNKPAVQAAITASWKALLLQRGEPGGTLEVSQIIGAIDAAPGEESHTLSLIDGGAPAAVSIGADNFPTDGGITFPP